MIDKTITEAYLSKRRELCEDYIVSLYPNDQCITELLPLNLKDFLLNLIFERIKLYAFDKSVLYLNDLNELIYYINKYSFEEIINTFSWDSTPEDSEFWTEINKGNLSVCYSHKDYKIQLFNSNELFDFYFDKLTSL